MLTRQDGKQQEKEPQDPPALLVGAALSKREATLLFPKPKVGTHICRGSAWELACYQVPVLSTAASPRARGPSGRSGPLHTTPGTQRPLA